MNTKMRKIMDALGQVMPSADTLKQAFSMEKGDVELDEQDYALINKLADYVVKRRMAEPALIFLESVRPLNFIGSQVMVFFRPILKTFFSFKDYERLSRILEKRTSIDILIEKIKELGGR